MTPKMSASALKAVVYIRLSVHRGATDPTTSPQRQREVCEAYCLSKGWEVVEVIEDLDVSGSDKGLRLERPGLRRVRDLFDDVDVVIFSKLDRLARNVIDFRSFAEEAQGHGVALVSVSDDIDLVSASGKFFATILAAFAELEAATIAARVTEGIAGTVALRRFRGGVVPFGYKAIPHDDGAGRALAIDPVEAAHVRAAADIVLGGGSAYAAMKTLIDRGSTPRRAKAWSLSSVITLLTGDAVLGRMTHHGAVVRDDDGTIAQPWPAVLPLEDVERLRARLAAKPAPLRRRRATRLLSGLLHCSSCSSRLRVSSSAVGGKRVLRYTCRGLADGSGCERPVSIVAEAVDVHVAQDFLARYGESPEIIVQERLPDVAGLAGVEEAIRLAAAAMTAPGADLAFLSATLVDLHEKRATLGGAKRETVVVTTGRTIREAWDATDIDGRRALIAATFADVIVGPGMRGRKGLDASRLTFVSNPAYSLSESSLTDWRPGRVVVA